MDLIVLKPENNGNLEILKRARDLPMLSQLGVLRQHGWEGGKAAVGGSTGVVILKNPAFVPPVTGTRMKNGCDGDE